MADEFKELSGPYKEDIKILDQKLGYCAMVAANNGWACESQMDDQLNLEID